MLRSRLLLCFYVILHILLLVHSFTSSCSNKHNNIRLRNVVSRQKVHRRRTYLYASSSESNKQSTEEKFELVEVTEEVVDTDADDHSDDGDILDQTPPPASLASPMSQWQSDEDEALYKMDFRRGENWLEIGTEKMLDTKAIPYGSLDDDDVLSILGLMASWRHRRTVEGCLEVERLLKRIVDDMRAGNTDIYITSRAYTIAIDAWGRYKAPGAAQRAQTIHDGMIELYRQSQDPNLAPSTMSYNTLLTAWSRVSEPEAVIQGEQALTDMLAWGTYEARPDAITFSTLLDIYARSSNHTDASRAEELFEMMGDMGLQQNVYTFLSLQQVYAFSGARNAPKRTLDVLQRMLNRKSAGEVFATPNCANYNAVLRACSRIPTRKNAQLATDLLLKMEIPVDQGGYDVEPDRLSYTFAILTCVKCQDTFHGANLAEANLQKLEARARMEAEKREEISSAAPPAVTLDIECFNMVIRCISKLYTRDSVKRVFSVIQRMENYAKNGQEDLRPNIRTWNIALSALGKSKERGCAQKVEQLLSHLFVLHEKGKLDAKPDAFTYASVLTAFRQAGTPTATRRADAILQEIEESYENGEIDWHPDVYHYTIVCGAWAVSGLQEATGRCIQILGFMKKRHAEGFQNVQPNVRTYNSVLDCLARGMEVEQAEQLLYHMLSLYKNGDESAKPDNFSFNKVINGYCHSDIKDAGQRAELLLERYFEFSEDDPGCKPDTHTFMRILSYYRQQDSMLDAPYRAEAILNRMTSCFNSGDIGQAPTVHSFTSCMDAYAVQSHPDAGRCAERILRQLVKLQNNPAAERLDVNAGVMNTVLNAWVSSGDECAGQSTETILSDMENRFQSGETNMRPNARTYSLVLTAWAKSSTFDKAEKAKAILERMKSRHSNGLLHMPPGEYVYSTVVNACAFTRAAPDVETSAFKIAVDTMTEALESKEVEVSSSSFGWFIQACGRLCPYDRVREENMERAFSKCCAQGEVNDFVLQKLRISTTDEQFRRLLSPVIESNHEKFKSVALDNIKKSIDLTDIPEQWKQRSYQRYKTQMF